jgi:hypothetical protein
VLRLSTVQPQVSAAISETFQELLSEQIEFITTFCTIYDTECGHALTKMDTHTNKIYHIEKNITQTIEILLLPYSMEQSPS